MMTKKKSRELTKTKDTTVSFSSSPSRRKEIEILLLARADDRVDKKWILLKSTPLTTKDAPHKYEATYNRSVRANVP